MRKKVGLFIAAVLGLAMLGLLVSTGVGPAAQAPVKPLAEASGLAEKQFAEAVTLLKQESYPEAIAAYEKVIRLSPQSPIAQDARYWIGQTYLRMGKYEEALAIFKKLLKDHPGSPIVPVTQLMVARVEREREAQSSSARGPAASDPSLIVDPANGAEYRRIHTLSGKSDVITGLGGFISPNGRYLLSESTVIPLDGSEPFPLTDKKAWRGTWSPDGKWAAFYAEQGIWIVPISPETGRSMGPPKKVLAGKYEFQYPVSWSPDSSRIALPRRDDTAEGDIWILALKDGTMTRLTEEPGYETNAFWRPDGRAMAYLTRGRRFEIRLSFGPGETPKTLVDMEVGELLSVSPDGRWMAFKDRQTLCLYRMADGRIFRIAPPEGVGKFLGWSGKGETALFARSSYEWKSLLRVGSTAGGPSFQLARGVDLWPYIQFWTAGCDRLIVPRAGDLRFLGIPLSGGEPTAHDLGPATEDKARPLLLSPGLDRLAFVVDRGNDIEDLYTIPVSPDELRPTGSPALVFRDWDRRQVLIQMSWSPDGTRIALIHQGDVWMTSATEEKRVQLTKTPEIEGAPRWSPQGDKIVFNAQIKEGDARLKVISASGGEATILTTPSEHNFCWSPDGKTVTVASNNKKLLHVQLDGSKPREILDLSGKGFTERFWGLTWLPDGKRIAFIAEPEAARGTSSLICVASVKTGEIVELMSDDKSWKDDLFVSPDGKWISYYTDQFIKTRPTSTFWEVQVADLVKEKK
jgi:Tol biopolymer transport system component